MKSKKSALLLSFTSLLICFAMLVGSTFAWFTDTETTGVNKIMAGNLKVDIVDGTTEQHLENLSFQNKENSDDILWEPGVTFLTQGFKIKNDGNLALKWKMTVNKGVKGETDQFDLKDVIDFSIVTMDTSADTPVEKEVDLAAFEGELPSGMSEVYYLKAHMQESAGNDYQNLTLDGITVTVYATQLNSENDSYGPDYDKDAVYPAVVSSLKEVNEAIASGNASIIIDGNFTVDVADNGGWTAFYFSKAEYPNMAKQIVLDGNGTVMSNKFAIWANLGADIVINGGTYDNTEGNESGEQLIYANQDGKITINGGTFIMKQINGGLTFNISNQADGLGGTIIIKGGLFNQKPVCGTAWQTQDEWNAETGTGIKVAEGYMIEEVTIDGATWYKVVAEN